MKDFISSGFPVSLTGAGDISRIGTGRVEVGLKYYRESRIINFVCIKPGLPEFGLKTG